MTSQKSTANQALLDPKNDVVFKMMLTAEGNNDVLIHLLTAILTPKSPITSVVIKNPEVPKKHITDKGTLLDIQADLGDGTKVNIEMQMKWHKYIPERSIYYLARLYASQLKRGDDYFKLKPAITIFLLAETGFTNAPAESFHYHYEMKDTKGGSHMRSLLHLHFIEINKLIKKINKNENIDDNFNLVFWCRFLYNPTDKLLDEVYSHMPVLKKAKQTLEEISASEHAREMARMREKAHLDYESGITEAKLEGRLEGEEIGLIKGKQEGRQEGRRDVLISLLKSSITNTLPNDDLASLTGLTIQDVIQCKKDLAGGKI